MRWAWKSGYKYLACDECGWRSTTETQVYAQYEAPWELDWNLNIIEDCLA